VRTPVNIYNTTHKADEPMAKNTSIFLKPHFDEFVSHQVSQGRFGSTSEVVRAGLRLLEDREVKLAALRKALIEGEESGFTEYSLDQLNRELDEEGLG
jgi:antitoxin ParD1/3/4